MRDFFETVFFTMILIGMLLFILVPDIYAANEVYHGRLIAPQEVQQCNQ